MTFLKQSERWKEIAESLPDVFYSGRITKVLGLIVEATLPGVPVGALCRIFINDEKEEVDAEAVGLRGDIVQLMPIGSTQGIKINDRVTMVSEKVTVQVSDKLLGRILDAQGRFMDKGPRLQGGIAYPLYNAAFSAVERKLVTEPLSLGVRSLDAFMTCGVGQRMAIMAGSGVGKSTLLGMMARGAKSDVNVIGLIGERGREVREFIEQNLGEEGLRRSVLIIATSDMPALTRMRAAFVATSIAEYFRDQGKKVLLMMDSLTRFAMASREVGLAMGEPPTVKGYTPSLFAMLPKLLERAGTSDKKGSITGLYTILTEGDDIQDPVADAVRSIVDGHIVLSRKLAVKGYYPPIDILNSLSRVMSAVASREHEKAMIKVRQQIALYEDMEDYIRMGFYVEGRNRELDGAVNNMPAIRRFLTQDVHDKANFEQSVAQLMQLSQ